MKMNRGLMDLQGQMTRFQISENGFTESWTDPLPDMEITHPDVVAVVSQHRQAHEQQQQQQVDVALPHQVELHTKELPGPMS